MLEFTPRIWQVGALCRAVADALDARFNPIAVRGEISGFSRASSGHCYFSLKDQTAQIRCVMFKRALTLLDFSPQDGELVDIRGRLGLYEPRGDLQFIVESMTQVGPGALFERFVKLKGKLEAEGLFDPVRKRALPLMPRGIGVVTSLSAAALHDVISALRRRVPHIPVLVAAASVQGPHAPTELSRALHGLYQFVQRTPDNAGNEQRAMAAAGQIDLILDAILLVRGGGSMEDLWAFNDESLARVIASSPVPIVSGVGHETDFTIADFVADVRAPTPTAAAELIAQPREACLAAIEVIEGRLRAALSRRLDRELQRIDNLTSRLGRPLALAAAERMALEAHAHRLRMCVLSLLAQNWQALRLLRQNMPARLQLQLERSGQRLARAQLRLGLLDPALVLQRGYAWLAGEDGRPITSPDQTRAGQLVRATLAAGTMELLVSART